MTATQDIHDWLIDHSGQGRLGEAAEEMGRLRDEVSDLRFLIGMALDKHGHSAWRGHVLRVSPHLLRRLRAAALGGSGEVPRRG